jgi:hypothetical protein
MSVNSEINRLNTAKTNIKSAIVDSGVSVPSTASISDYDDYVRAIPNAVLTSADGRYKKINVSEYSFTPNLAYYGSSTVTGSHYYKISITKLNNIWTMCNVELSLKESFTPGCYGKLFIHFNKNNTSNAFSEVKALKLGTLSDSIKVYISNNATSIDIYIAGNWNYSTVDVNRIIFGDTAAGIAEKTFTITTVTSLPSSKTEATIITSLHTSNISSYITDSVSTTSSEISGSATAVKTAYDKAVAAYNLANGKTSNTGTVTKVTAGTGLSGGDITTSGSISISSTYQTYITNGNTAHSWGNHASAGYIKGITKSMVTTALGYTPPTSDTNTWRDIYVNGTKYSGSAIDFAAGSNVSLTLGTADSGGKQTLTIAATNTTNTAGSSNKTGTKMFLVGATSTTTG